MQANVGWLRRLMVGGAMVLGVTGISAAVAPAATAGTYTGTFETQDACQRAGVANVAAHAVAGGPTSPPLGAWFECERLGAPAGYDWLLTVHVS